MLKAISAFHPDSRSCRFTTILSYIYNLQHLLSCVILAAICRTKINMVSAIAVSVLSKFSLPGNGIELLDSKFAREISSELFQISVAVLSDTASLLILIGDWSFFSTNSMIDTRNTQSCYLRRQVSLLHYGDNCAGLIWPSSCMTCTYIYAVYSPYFLSLIHYLRLCCSNVATIDIKPMVATFCSRHGR